MFSGESSARDLVQSSWTRGILLEAFRQPNLSAKCVQSSVQSVGWENVDMSDMSMSQEFQVITEFVSFLETPDTIFRHLALTDTVFVVVA